MASCCGMPVEIREALPGESERLIPAYEWLFAPPGSAPPGWDEAAAQQRLEAAIAAEDAEILIALEDGEVVGLCSAYLDLDSVRFGLRCWVEDLAVHPDRRSQGIGKRLLDAAKEWGSEHGATHLELDSGEARADAHRFYERERPDWKSGQFSWVLGQGR